MRRSASLGFARKRTVLRTATAERSYMCSLLHNLPSEELLAQVPAKRVLNYQPYWTSSANITARSAAPRQSLAKGQVCLVSFLSDGRVSFLPMPGSAESVNYAIGYDFALAAPEFRKRYVHTYSFGGFSIVSIPQNDFIAALRFYGQGDLANALLFSDRAITSLASINPNAMSEESERNYAKFLKLLNLWLSVQSTPEGDLAAKRALQFAKRCFLKLTATQEKE